MMHLSEIVHVGEPWLRWDPLDTLIVILGLVAVTWLAKRA